MITNVILIEKVAQIMIALGINTIIITFDMKKKEEEEEEEDEEKKKKCKN